MITRSKLVEQLRDYQLQSQQNSYALTFFSPKPILSSWKDVVVAILYALIFVGLLISSYVALYLEHYRISFTMLCLGVLHLIRLRISRQSLKRKRERKLLLPLSM